MSEKSGGVGFVGTLTILFIGLKITGIITWDWIWVLSPLWISFVVLFVALFIAIAYTVVTDG